MFTVTVIFVHNLIVNRDVGEDCIRSLRNLVTFAYCYISRNHPIYKALREMLAVNISFKHSVMSSRDRIKLSQFSVNRSQS